MESLTTVQRVVLGTAICAFWLYRFDVQFGRQEKEQTTYMATWHSVLKDWDRREEVAKEMEQVSRVQQASTAWMAQRRRIQQIQRPGITQGECKALKKQRRKEEVKQQVLKECDLEEDPPEVTVRAWTDGSEQAGLDGNQYAGYGVWFGASHVLNCAQVLPGQRQTTVRAELTAVLLSNP